MPTFTYRHVSNRAADLFSADGQPVGFVFFSWLDKQDRFIPTPVSTFSAEDLVEIARMVRQRSVDREYGS